MPRFYCALCKLDVAYDPVIIYNGLVFHKVCLTTVLAHQRREKECVRNGEAQEKPKKPTKSSQRTSRASGERTPFAQPVENLSEQTTRPSETLKASGITTRVCENQSPEKAGAE